MVYLSTLTSFLPVLTTIVLAAPQSKSKPIVTIKNGTYAGKYVQSFNQDLFLGVPYAQPPVGDLRLRNPQSLTTTFGVRNATEYAASCIGYGNGASWPYTLSEDCLTLNIVRPAGHQRDPLPVGVFIHGGGWIMDYSANGNYNLSFIVGQSQQIQKPIIAVSLDYRLSAWGFLASQDVLDAGVANLGLKDQRLALHWIQENIAAFGGDPSKVTIWGESAGGGNVGYQATAFGGHDDGLFRGLIAESGAEGSRQKDLTAPTTLYNSIVSGVGCTNSTDKLACLRGVPVAVLNQSIATSTNSFYPIVDGDFVSDYSSTLLEQGKFAKVPALLGTNINEGTLFARGRVYNTTASIESIIKSAGPDDNTTAVLLNLYPDIDSLGLPELFHTPTNFSGGSQYKRAVTLLTDQGFLAWRRLRSDAWSDFGVPSYSYLFEAPSANAALGTPHFFEIVYVFDDTLCLGDPAPLCPFNSTASADVYELGKLMSRMWVSFIHELDPNGHKVKKISQWPVYNGTGGYGQDMYLSPSSQEVIPDTFRLAGTSFINSVARSQYGR